MLSLLAAADNEPPVYIEEVQVTASRQASTPFQATAAVSVINPDDSGSDNIQIITDLLRSVPGVFVQQTTPGQGIPIVRGLKGSEVLHLVDGIRLNNAFFRNAPNQYIALVDSSNIEQAEVVRGPSSTLYGADALGGVIQFITPQPEFRSGDEAADFVTELSASSADSAWKASASVADGSERFAYRIQASYQDVGNRETARGEVGPSGFESRAISAGVRFLSGENSEWTINLQHLEQPSTPRVDELIAGFDQTEPDSSEFFFEPNERTFARVKYYNEAPNSWSDSRQLQLAYQKLVDDRRSRGLDASSRRLENNESDLYGLVGQADKLLDNGIGLIYGFEFYHDEVSSSRFNQDLGTGEISTTGARFPDGSTQDSVGLYLQAEWGLGQNADLTAGLRYSNFDVSISQADRETGGELDVDQVTGNLGLNYAVTEQVNWVTNLGQGFRAPNIFDLSTLGDRPGNRFNVPNSNLGPEEVLTLDSGIKWQTPDFVGEVFAFVSEFDDKITSVETGELTDTDRVIVQSENLNKVTLYGVELGARYFTAQQLELFTNMGWVWAEEESPDGSTQAADRIPPFSGVLGVRWPYSEQLDFTFDTRFARRQNRLSARDIRDPRINPDGTAGWATFNVRMDWQPSQTWQFGLALENLFDKAYREHGSGIDARGIDFLATIRAQF